MSGSSDPWVGSGPTRSATWRRLGVVAVVLAFLAGLLVTSAPPAASVSSITDLGSTTPEDLAQSLAGAGVTVQNVSFTGADVQGGSFGESDALGFSEGIILSSGDVNQAVGPNETGSMTTEGLGLGDADLDGLVADPTYDAAVLEFEFVPEENTVAFEYVFASEEYNEYVFGGVDDVFGFFVNGTNCATVNGERVSIDSINNGNPFGSLPNSNPGLFRNNDLDDGGATIDIQADGLTTVLECVASVNPGQVNTMKLAIADVGDDLLDSWVFLQAGSFESVTPQTGQLRVTTDPAIPAEIIVDGVPRDSWGLNWVEFPVGEHEVCFGPVPGFTPPPCQDIVVSLGQTTEVQGIYGQRGTLRVLTSPAVPSTITIDGLPANDWGVWTDLDPGTYQVCFGAVADMAEPACQEAVVGAGSTTEITGVFTADPGSPGPTGHGYLRATTNPAVASRISIDGSVADTWGLTWLKLDPGTYEVCFEPVLYTTAPSCQEAVITAGNTTEVEGVFEAHGFLQVLTDPAVPVTISVDGHPANAWGVWTSKPPGNYEVCFGEFEGQPGGCQGAVVTAGNTTTISASYGT